MKLPSLPVVAGIGVVVCLCSMAAFFTVGSRALRPSYSSKLGLRSIPAPPDSSLDPKASQMLIGMWPDIDAVRSASSSDIALQVHSKQQAGKVMSLSLPAFPGKSEANLASECIEQAALIKAEQLKNSDTTDSTQEVESRLKMAEQYALNAEQKIRDSARKPVPPT